MKPRGSAICDHLHHHCGGLFVAEAGNFCGRARFEHFAVVDRRNLGEQDDRCRPVTQELPGDGRTGLLQMLLHDRLQFLDTVAGDGVQELQAIVQKHLEETGSAVAGQLLRDWAASVVLFTQITPVNYRKVLEERGAAEVAGLSDEETTAVMM